jgi:hypothetical protein
MSSKTLYRTFLKEAARFPSSNLRNYVCRKVRDEFTKERSPQEQMEAIEKAKDQLAQLVRIKKINDLYKSL